MAQKVQMILVSDISGEEIADGGQSIEFSYRGVSYQIDLTDAEAEKFDKAIEKYTSAATRTGGRASRGTSKSRSTNRDYDPAEVRAWATSQGIEVPSRGRIPAEVLEKYKNQK